MGIRPKDISHKLIQEIVDLVREGFGEEALDGDEVASIAHAIWVNLDISNGNLDPVEFNTRLRGPTFVEIIEDLRINKNSKKE